MPPDDLTAPALITPEEFRAKGYEAVLADNPGASYSVMWTNFRIAADAAEVPGDGKGRILGLLDATDCP